MSYKNIKNKKILKTLLKVSQDVSSSLDMDRVSDTILKQARAVLNTDYSALFILDDDTKKLILIGAVGFSGNQVENLKVLGGWEGINVEVVKKAKPIIVNDIGKSHIFRKKKIAFSGGNFPLGSFLAVPLKTEDGIIGVLIVSNHKKRKTRFGAEDRNLLHPGQ